MNRTHKLSLLRGAPIIPTASPAKYRTIRSNIRCNIRYTTVALLVACVVACGGGDATGPVATPPVTLLFALQQVNGQNVPATFPMTDGTLVISSGTMKLTPEKTFSESVFYTFAPTGSAAVPDTALTVGTYSQTGADILFTIPPSPSAPGSTFTGTVTGNTLRYSDGGFVAVYGR